MHSLKAFALLGALALSPAACAQQAGDPAAVLRVARERLLSDLERMPRYTCEQTITRTYYETHAARGSSCPASAHDSARHAPQPFGWDRLHLEVAWAGGTDIYSWVGEPAFSAGNLENLAGDGPLVSGDFGVFLRQILLETTPTFHGEDTVSGRRLLAYSYEAPQSQSGWRVRTSSGLAPIPYSGTLLLDPQTSDLVSLTMRAGELPRESASCRAETETAFQRASIHDRVVLLPRETSLDIISPSGTESVSRAVYSNCREFASSVRLAVGAHSSNPEPRQPGPSTAQPAIAADVRFSARIITPIDSDTASAGDPIEAELRSPLRGGDRGIVAPAGARIHGRLTAVRWWSQPVSTYQIAVRFESVQVEGRSIPLSAILDTPPLMMLIGAEASRAAALPQNEKDPAMGGWFSFSTSHLRLKTLDAEWVTHTQ